MRADGTAEKHVGHQDGIKVGAGRLATLLTVALASMLIACGGPKPEKAAVGAPSPAVEAGPTRRPLPTSTPISDPRVWLGAAEPETVRGAPAVRQLECGDAGALHVETSAGALTATLSGGDAVCQGVVAQLHGIAQQGSAVGAEVSEGVEPFISFLSATGGAMSVRVVELSWEEG